MTVRSLLIQFQTASLAIVGFSSTLQAALPVSHIKGINELFHAKYRIYSPEIGLNQDEAWIQDLLNQGEVLNRPEIKLVRLLFSPVPGGEVFPTHLSKNPAAHLSSASIARIFLEFEKFKDLAQSKTEFVSSFKVKVAFKVALKNCLINDPGYQTGMSEAREVVFRAEKELDEADQLLVESARQSEAAEAFKDQNITVLDRKIKKLRAESKRNPTLDQTELAEFNQARISLLNQYEEMKKGVPKYSKILKTKEKHSYLRDSHDVDSQSYLTRLDVFVETLAESFYQDAHQGMQGNTYTRQLLLRYLWCKYNQKSDLKGYLEVMQEGGALKANRLMTLTNEFYQDYYTLDDYQKFKTSFSKAFFKTRWIRRHFSDAVALTRDNVSGKELPPMVPFGYLKWISYSGFPDCGENVLHNIINLISFNPDTGTFDYRILESMKENHYPNLNDKLISFYRAHPRPDEHNSKTVASEWIQVVSELNQGIEELDLSKKVHYLRERKTHLYGTFRNLIKAMNRLFGYDDIATDHMQDIFAHLREISDREILYSADALDTEGFGTVLFTIDQHAFKLHSHRPFHVSFKYFENTNDQALEKLKKALVKAQR